MSTPATHEDANVILRLYELRREDKLRQARDWFAKNFRPKTMEEFDRLCPQGSDANAYARMVISYWEMVASFITAGVLNQDLFFQSGREMLLCYERVRPLLAGIREMFQDPNVWKNLETVCGAYARHIERNSPNAYKAFVARVG